MGVSRLPLTHPIGWAGWAVVLSVVHPVVVVVVERCGFDGEVDRGEKKKGVDDGSSGEYDLTIVGEESSSSSSLATESIDPWNDLPLEPLVKHKQTTCVPISRTTLITLFCVTNARPVFRYSSASGHRAAYASYCGQWRIEWPIGDVARVYFSAHDSHQLSKDVYPPSFQVRVDKSLQMLAGVIEARKSNGEYFRCAFSGRKPGGEYILRYAAKGFGGAHGSRHLYNMLGGNVNDVDFLTMKRVQTTTTTTPTTDMHTIHLPSREDEDEDGKNNVTLYIPEAESGILNEALDCLPWSTMSWSIHRGLRDILVAFAKQRMDLHRSQLADALRYAVAQWPERLVARGWDARFVRDRMADMAASGVLAERGDSGDVVRIVTDIALVWRQSQCGSNSSSNLSSGSVLDETMFWRRSGCGQQSCGVGVGVGLVANAMDVIALVKCFVLEWSNELDYQMYHDLPMELFLG